MSHKAAETTCNINNAFGPGTANEHTVQWWFKKFCKGDESLKDEEHSGLPSEVDSDQLKGSLKLILLQLHKKLWKNSVLAILWLFSIWSKLKRWKSSLSEYLMSWLKVKKNHRFKCFLTVCNNNEPFLNRIVMCNEKLILYDSHWWPAQWLDQQESPKHFPKPNLPQEKVMVTSGLLLV